MFQDNVNAIIPVAGIIMTFSMPVIIVIAILVYKAHRASLIHETVARLVEKGLPIPPELFADKPENEKSVLQKGVLLIALGAGLIVMFLTQEGTHAPWGIGMIPLLIGVGYLIVWKLEKRAPE